MRIIKKSDYEKSWEYLKEGRFYFLVVALIFLASVWIGYFFPVFFVEFIEKFIKTLLERTEGMSLFQLFLFIFQNNLSTAFFALLLGLFFGIFPLILTFLNGYVLGFVSGKVSGVAGFTSLFRLVPHGIFELPALIISLGLGVRLGMFFLAKEGERKKYFLYNLENSLRVFVFVILPLLLVAALIEASLIFWLG